MQLVSLRTHFLNHQKRANKTRLELTIPFQINVTYAQQDRITKSEVNSIMHAIVLLRLMLICMLKGCLCLHHLLDYIAHIPLSTDNMNTADIYLPTYPLQSVYFAHKPTKKCLMGRILCGTAQRKLYKWYMGNPLAILINRH